MVALTDADKREIGQVKSFINIEHYMGSTFEALCLWLSWP